MIESDALRANIERILPRVEKPARYIGGELNVIRKDPRTQNIKVCLAFPDVYDIGQSYLGFYILYHILNKQSGILCERTFAPWVDMEAEMCRENIPLWSLESMLPVAQFDVVGFTLQYELHYTTVLNMLELAGIPIRAGERDGKYPLIIGGGPCCANPEPVADFFDAFLLGDGEEAFPEILDVIGRCRREGISKADTLRELTRIGGVYVPSLYRVCRGGDGSFIRTEPVDDRVPFPVRSRMVEKLKPEYYSDRPLVPICEVVHDRLAVEIMRGCSRGCRFCGAGMVYRPRRFRPANDIVQQVVRGIRATGWEDVSLVSLSNSDYPGLENLVQQLGGALKGKKVSISLASLRADNFSVKMADTVAGGKRTSLTFAVEAATQRLRDVINKNLTEEQLFETLNTALTGGWNSFKLYFMIGLPTETEEDVLAIPEMLNRIGNLLRKHRGRRVNVTISPFSPKPMTPFQWERQDSLGELERKYDLIKKNLRSRAIHLKMTNPHVSKLECLLGRGGRELGNVLVDAWKRGSRLDGWSEHFNREVWHRALEQAGYAFPDSGDRMEPGSPLPWEHLDFGVDGAYFLSERERAYGGETTPDCSEACQNCGPYASFCAVVKRAASPVSPVPEAMKRTDTEDGYGRKRKSIGSRQVSAGLLGTRMRMKFTKGGAFRYTGHLDMVRVFDRAMRRSAIPIAYSQGFHPHPKLSFGPPLPLGIKSVAEYVDFSIVTVFPEIATELKKELPEGFALMDIRAVPERAESLNNLIRFAEYRILGELDDATVRKIEEVLAAERIVIERTTKKGTKSINVRPGIEALTVFEDRSGFTMLLSMEQPKAVKPREILEIIFGKDFPVDVTRIEQYAVRNGKMITPLEV